MTVSSAPAEETSSQSLPARLSRANAFRVLSLPADAELRQIDRQQLRLLVAFEHGEQSGTEQYGLAPLGNVSKEEILEAVHLLQTPEDRLIEELFWVHEMDGLEDRQRHNVLGGLRGESASNMTHGAVARHNLAVMHRILGQECDGNSRLDHWSESLKIWKELMDDDLFWAFMKDRALRIHCQKSDFRMLKAAVCQQLSSNFSEEMVRAVKLRELPAVSILVRIAVEHKSWLDFAATLKLVGQQETKNGFVSLGAIFDRLSIITQQDDKTNIRSSLVELERELRGVAGRYGDIVRSLGELGDADGWDDALASSYQRLSGAYLSLLDDPDQAARLIAQARALARNRQWLQSMERDWRNIQRVILCREADALARSGDFDGAGHRLAAALAISTEQQKTELKLTQERYRLACESAERNQRQVQRATLCREAGVLVQSGDFAAAEHNLAVALTMSTEEQKLEIKAMQDCCRWARMMRGVDTTRKNPGLSTLIGIGGTFHGKRDYDPLTRSYVTNHWLTFVFVPIFPLGAYRVTDADFRSFDIHGKTPLPNFLKTVRWAIAASVIALVPMAVIGRWTSPKTVAATSTNAIASTQTAGATEAPAEKSAIAPHSERDDIEQERTALIGLVQSLEDRKRTLDAEDADLNKQKRYLASVAASYAGENVPGSGQSTFAAVFAEFSRKVKKYNADLAVLNADYAAFNERVHSLNARIQVLNGLR